MKSRPTTPTRRTTRETRSSAPRPARDSDKSLAAEAKPDQHDALGAGFAAQMFGGGGDVLQPFVDTGIGDVAAGIAGAGIIETHRGVAGVLQLARHDPVEPVRARRFLAERIAQQHRGAARVQPRRNVHGRKQIAAVGMEKPN